MPLYMFVLYPDKKYLGHIVYELSRYMLLIRMILKSSQVIR